MRSGASIIAASTAEGPRGSTAEVIEAMEGHRAAIKQAGSDYNHYDPFWGIYLPVTVEVELRRLNDEFAEPEELERATCNFHWTAELALKAATEGSEKDVPEFWRPGLINPVAKRAGKAIQGALGMGAHIYGDLPFVVEKTGSNKNYKQDYTTGVGAVLGDVGHIIAPDYLPLPGLMRHQVTKRVIERVAISRDTAYDQGITLYNLRHDDERDEEIRDQEYRDFERAIHKNAATGVNRILYAGSLALSPFTLWSALLRGNKGHDQLGVVHPIPQMATEQAQD